MDEHPLSLIKTEPSTSEVLIGGEWITYGLMSKSFETPYPHGKHLGKSKYIRINGIEHEPLEIQYHFWRS